MTASNIKINNPDRVVLVTLPSWPEYGQQVAIMLSNNSTLVRDYSGIDHEQVGTPVHAEHMKCITAMKESANVEEVEHHKLDWADMKYMGDEITTRGITPFLMLSAYLQKHAI